MWKSLSTLKRVQLSSVTERHKEADRIRKMIFGYKSEMNRSESVVHRRLENLSFPHHVSPPSKFNFQDFRIEQYLMMQAERFSPREVDPTMKLLKSMVIQFQHRLPKMEKLLARVSLSMMRKQPTLQDVHGFMKVLKKGVGNMESPSHSQCTKGMQNIDIDGLVTRNGLNSTQTHSQEYEGVHQGNEKLFTETVVPHVGMYESSGSGKMSKASVGSEENVVEKREPEKRFSASDVSRENDWTASFHTTDNLIQDGNVQELRTGPSSIQGINSIDKGLERFALSNRIRRELHAECYRKKLQKLLSDPENEEFQELFRTRNRFVDPVYWIRRNHFLSRSGVMKPKEKVKTNHYRIHPDALVQYPSHKGRPFIRYPSVHK